MRPVCLLDRTKNLYQSDRLHFISVSLKPAETEKFVASTFRDGRLKTTGTALDAILPPVRRFGGGRAAKKRSVIEKLKAFFDKFMGVVEA